MLFGRHLSAYGTVTTTLGLDAAAAHAGAFRRGGGSGPHFHDAATGAFRADHGVLGRGRAAHSFVG
jgi:hypothetical protein